MSRWGGVPPKKIDGFPFCDFYFEAKEPKVLKNSKGETVYENWFLANCTMIIHFTGLPQAPRKTFREQLEEEFKNIGWNW